MTGQVSSSILPIVNSAVIYLGKGFSQTSDSHRHSMNVLNIYNHKNDGDGVICISKYWLPVNVPDFRGVLPYS